MGLAAGFLRTFFLGMVPSSQAPSIRLRFPGLQSDQPARSILAGWCGTAVRTGSTAEDGNHRAASHDGHADVARGSRVGREHGGGTGGTLRLGGLPGRLLLGRLGPLLHRTLLAGGPLLLGSSLLLGALLLGHGTSPAGTDPGGGDAKTV